MRPSLLLTYDFPPMSGGIARLQGEIARHAPADCLVVSTGRMAESEGFDSGCASRVDRVDVESQRLRNAPGLARWGWQARRLAREQGSQFLWAGNLKPAGHVARSLSRRVGLPYGLMVYGLDLLLLAEQSQRSLAKRLIARRLVRDAATTVAISRWTADRFRELALSLGFPEAPVRIVLPGVDHTRFRPGLRSAELRARLGLNDRRWLLTVARLEPHKGIDQGLEVVEALRREGLDVGYIVAGAGPAEAALRQECEARGLTPYVRFCGHVVDRELPALYGVADLYLGLSRRAGRNVEGFGLALLEAQASGLPVVAGESGGAADAVDHGTTGFLVPPADLGAIVLAVRGLLQDRTRIRTFGAAARARVERGFGWNRVLRELDDAAEAASTGPEARALR
jgi:phosphatidylinositol alpha-1,6-mannosyltransferase